MRTLRKIMLPSLVAAIAAASARDASAQIDVEPPMPNVMIMLDTSGSMLRKMSDDGTNANWMGDLTSDCATDNAADINEVRWFALVQALTGEIATPRCTRIDRSGSPFEDRYGANVQDVGYYIPFFQLQSGACGLIPNPNYKDWNDAGATDWFDFPDDINNDAIISWDIDNDALGTCGPAGTANGFVQQSSGIIDVFKRRVRFGLMTFDPLVGDESGVNNANDDVDVAAGARGTWSYWSTNAANNWYTHLGKATGRPVACTTDQDMEVGARGPAAPPWEGRLMGFGYEKATSQEVADANERIEKIIASVRPYGATPLAGMMKDLYDLALNEDKYLPAPGSSPFVRPLGAKMNLGLSLPAPNDDVGDHLWKEGAGCRPFHVILITDGEPNLDLRPDCELDDPGGNGRCPFPPIVDSPQNKYTGFVVRSGEQGPIVNDLNQNHNVIFHVVGISVGEVDDPSDGSSALVSCTDDRYSSLDGSRCDSGASPEPTAREKVCCLLNSIQFEGNGRSSSERVAYYAADKSELQNALNLVLNDIASGTATRTTPTFQAVSPNFYIENADAAAVGHEVHAALETVVGDGLWSGRLERARVACVDVAGVTTPVVQLPVDATKGDDFAANVKVNVANRKLYTVVPDDVSNEAWRSLRPELGGVIDGIAENEIDTPIVESATTWASNSAVQAQLALSSAKCTTDFGTPTCGEELLKWYAGLASTGPTRSSPLGAIYHTQPVIVGPPREYVRDEAYDQFAAIHQDRPTVLYTSTVDGQLHAFLVADNTKLETDHEPTQADVSGENNELWSFVPPIVLPHLQPYVDRHALLLDGGITVRNIAKARTSSDAGNTANFRNNGAYRTYLVASSGRASQIEGNGYYFALDVSDPFDQMADGTAGLSASEAPKFLWQLSRLGSGAGTITDPALQMFGKSLPPAAITTISYQGPTDTVPAEIPVAILAGGVTGTPAAGEVTSYVSGLQAPGNLYDIYGGSVAPRNRSRNWTGSRPDRSVTIVRLDTGEVIFRFIGQATDPTLGLPTERLRVGNFFAPISGTPVPYPGLPGQVSTRVFIGDADGMLWALDLSDPDPDNTSGSNGWKMQIAWDPYHGVATSDILDGTVTIGPVETEPVVSVDDAGDPVVLFATGGQEDFYRNVGKNFVVSLKDSPGTAGYELNWELDLEDVTDSLGGVPGQRVTGPLNLFDGVAYFATFVPDNDACNVGQSRLWGLDYVAKDVGDHPIAMVDLSSPADGSLDRYTVLDGTVFGVGISQKPSCRDGTVDHFDDPIYGGYSGFQSAPPGGFELVVMTGRKAPLIGQPANSGDLLRVTRGLPTPRATVKVDSWAAIVE